jgi:hypothetical protein
MATLSDNVVTHLWTYGWRRVMTKSRWAPKTPLALATPNRNRGVGFTYEERRTLGLAQRVIQNMLDTSAKAVAHQPDPTSPGAGLLPDMTNLRVVSAMVAEAAYHSAVADGVATKRHDSVVQAILDAMSVPEHQAEIQ